jgi:hypothetical protein
MKKEELKRVSFDSYLTSYLFDFIRTPGNHVRVSKAKLRLKKNVKFSYTNAPNRNKIVSDDLWVRLIHYHLKKHNKQ